MNHSKEHFFYGGECFKFGQSVDSLTKKLIQSESNYKIPTNTINDIGSLVTSLTQLQHRYKVDVSVFHNRNDLTKREICIKLHDIQFDRISWINIRRMCQEHKLILLCHIVKHGWNFRSFDYYRPMVEVFMCLYSFDKKMIKSSRYAKEMFQNDHFIRCLKVINCVEMNEEPTESDVNHIACFDDALIQFLFELIENYDSHTQRLLGKSVETYQEKHIIFHRTFYPSPFDCFKFLNLDYLTDLCWSLKDNDQRSAKILDFYKLYLPHRNQRCATTNPSTWDHLFGKIRLI